MFGTDDHKDENQENNQIQGQPSNTFQPTTAQNQPTAPPPSFGGSTVLGSTPPVEEKSEEVPETEPSAPTPPATADSDGDDLAKIKKEALEKLSPIVQHLDQDPAEKFRTIMMMLQASDDKSLVKQAYATAQEISDEKEKAKALLAVVNEIEYFSQNENK